MRPLAGRRNLGRGEHLESGSQATVWIALPCGGSGEGRNCGVLKILQRPASEGEPYIGKRRRGNGLRQTQALQRLLFLLEGVDGCQEDVAYYG